MRISHRTLKRQAYLDNKRGHNHEQTTSIPLLSTQVYWEFDQDGDASYLDRTADDHYGTNTANWAHISAEERAKIIAEFGAIRAACEHYAEEDRKRLEAFNRGDWNIVGCYAVAEVRNPDTHVVQRIRSGGLWDIESDSDPTYRAQIEKEQLDELREELTALGVETEALA